MLAGLLLALFLNFFLAIPVNALPESSSDSVLVSGTTNELLEESKFLTGGLKEVPPPVIVEKMRKRLAVYHPELSLLSPARGETLLIDMHEKWEIVLKLKDWPLVEDPVLGLGPHLVVQVDDGQPIRISNSEGERVVIAMDGLTPGTHRIGAYLAFPWGEALKSPGSSLESRVSFFKHTEGTQPDFDQTWLTVVSPSSLSFKEPLLIDSLIWNAPLQGFKEGDDRWRLKITINGDSFLLKSQEPIWLKGIDSDTNIVQFQLLNNFGDPVQPIFNNQVRLFKISQVDEPIWLNSNLTQNELSKLLGEAQLLKASSLIQEHLGDENELISPKESDDPSIAKYELIFPK